MKKLLLSVYWLTHVTANCFPQSGALDNTFGTGGKVTTDIGNSDNKGNSVAIQNDGKIVVAGYTGNYPFYDFALLRYNTNGTLDSTFNSDGKLTTDFGGTNDNAWSVAVQNDGKIVVAGFTGDNYYVHYALARYTIDGTPDSTFDLDGIVTTDIVGHGDQAFSVAIQNDDKIVAAGTSYNGTEYDFAVVRYNPDGSLDTTFDSDGKVTTAFGGDGADGRSVLIQSDGKIVVAGLSTFNGNGDFALARYNSDGSLDITFDADGKVTTDFGAADEVFSVAVQSDGKILATGYSFCGTTYDFGLARYNTNGSLDSTFGSGGKITTAIGTAYDEAYSGMIQNDGKIIAAGASSAGGANVDISLIRYNTDGSLDNTFGSGGRTITDIGGSYDEGFSMAIQGDGKIVIAGESYNGSDWDLALVRYNNNTVGMAEIARINEVTIYPNPSSGIFTVSLRNPIASKILIYNMLGNCLLNKQSYGDMHPKIDLTGQPKGVYFLEIVFGDERVVKKIVLE